MEYKDGIEKNKAYVNLGMNDSKKNKLLENCKNKKEEIKSGTIDLNLRRNEKMNKGKRRFDVFQKVCVASLSIIATGAIIFGASKYNANRKTISSSNVVTDKNIAGGKYDKVFADSIGEGLTPGSLDTSMGQVELGDYFYELEGLDSQGCSWLSIKGKEDDKFTEIKDLKFEDRSSVYSNGKYIFAIYQNCLNKYDIKNNIVEKIDISKVKSLTENKDKTKFGEYIGIWEIVTIEKGIAYLVVGRDGDEPNNSGVTTYELVTYDIYNNEFSIEIENYKGAFIDYEGYMIIQYKKDSDNRVISLYSYTSNGLHEEKQIAEKAEFREPPDASKNIVYYVGNGEYENKEFNGDEFELLQKLKLYSYDIINDKEKELAEIDVKDFGKDAYFISSVELLSDEVCQIGINDKDGEVQNYKYTFATKKIEK